VRRLKRLVIGLLTRRTAFYSLPVHVSCVVYLVTMEEIFLQVFSFYPLNNIPATIPVLACLQASAEVYRSADKSLARPTCRCSLFDGENISFDASIVIYINSINIPPIMIINRTYETQNLLSL